MKLRGKSRLSQRSPASAQVIEYVNQKFVADGITPARIHERVVLMFTERERQFALDAATAMRPDVAIYLDQPEAEGRWKHELPTVQATIEAELRADVFQRLTEYAQGFGCGLREMVVAADLVLSGYCREAEEKMRENGSSAAQSNAILRRRRDSEQKDEGGSGLLGGLFSLFAAVADRPQAVAAWNSRELFTFRSDCAQVQLSAWEAIRREGQTLPGAILALQNTLITADQTAILGEVPQTETPIWPHTRLSWEDPRDLADAITASDVAPGLPSDLLLELLHGEELAIASLERDAKAKAIDTANALALGGLQAIHGPAMQAAARPMLLCINDGARDDSVQFQIGEMHPERGDVTHVWPPVRRQADVLATPGRSLVVGYLRIDAATELAEVFGSSTKVTPVTIDPVSPKYSPSTNGAALTH